MDCCNISPDELVLVCSTTAIAISKKLDNDELSILGAFLTTLGDNLSLIASSREICKQKD